MSWFVFYSVYPVGVTLGFWQPLRRPAGVSQSARFVSLIKTASWLDCSIDSVRNVNVCKVWDEKGNLRISGDFQYEDQHRAATKKELYPSMAAGPDTVYLSDGPHGTWNAHKLRRVGAPPEIKGTVTVQQGPTFIYNH